MAFMNWNDEFSVSIKSIDVQHKVLFRMINEFAEAFHKETPREEIALLIDELVNYTVVHFAKEEKLFAILDYDDTAAHIATHKALIAKVTDIRNAFNRGEDILTQDTLEFLKSWLINHIKGIDTQYTAHFHANGLY